MTFKKSQDPNLAPLRRECQRPSILSGVIYVIRGRGFGGFHGHHGHHSDGLHLKQVLQGLPLKVQAFGATLRQVRHSSPPLLA